MNSVWNKEKLPEERNESIVVPIYKIKQNVVIIEASQEGLCSME